MPHQLQCELHPFGSLSPLKYVVVCSFHKGQYMLSRHRLRDTWETQGGHIEPGETPLEAARRELFEESGAREADLYPVCDYRGFTPQSSANGAVFLAVVHHPGRMPESEMQECACFDCLPPALTYPGVTPVLMARALRLAREKKLF